MLVTVSVLVRLSIPFEIRGTILHGNRGSSAVRCPDCQFENRDDRRYCAECGRPLPVICPDCGFQNVIEDNYCGGCGAPLDKTHQTPTVEFSIFDEEAAESSEDVSTEQNFADTQTIFGGVIQDTRKFPRVRLRFPGQVLLADGGMVKVTVHDVSPDGIQIRCNREKAFILHPDARSIRDGEIGPELQIFFTVPLGPVRAPVKVVGRIIFFALINPKLIALGVRFTSISTESRSNLESLIRQALRPKTAKGRRRIDKKQP